METLEWRRKRSILFINMLLSAFTFGLTMTAYNSTEYFYLKDLVKASTPTVYFGISRALLYASGIIATFITSYYADQTKNIRLIFIAANMLGLVGNVLYLIYYSVSFILIGQILTGLSSARNVAGFGEVARIYHAKVVSQKVAMLSIFSLIGLVLGPCNVIAFKNVDINLGFLKINTLNTVGVFMASMHLIELFLVFFTLDNVSLIHNVKQEDEQNMLLTNMEKEETCEKPLNKVGLNGKGYEYIKTLKRLFQDTHIMFIFFTCFCSYYITSTIVLLEPIKAHFYFNWCQQDVALFTLITQLSGSLPMPIVLLVFGKYMNKYFVLLTAFVITAFSIITLGMFPYFSSTRIVGIVLLYTAGITRTASGVIFYITARSMIAEAVPENIQTISDGIRNILIELGRAVAGLIIYLPVHYMTVTLGCILFYLSVAIAWYIVEKKHFEHLKLK